MSSASARTSNSRNHTPGAAEAALLAVHALDARPVSARQVGGRAVRAREVECVLAAEDLGGFAHVAAAVRKSGQHG